MCRRVYIVRKCLKLRESLRRRIRRLVLHFAAEIEDGVGVGVVVVVGSNVGEE